MFPTIVAGGLSLVLAAANYVAAEDIGSASVSAAGAPTAGIVSEIPAQAVLTRGAADPYAESLVWPVTAADSRSAEAPRATAL